MTKLGLQKFRICPKVTKMKPIICNRIDFYEVGALRGQRHIPSKNLPKYPPPNRGISKGCKGFTLKFSWMVAGTLWYSVQTFRKKAPYGIIRWPSYHQGTGGGFNFWSGQKVGEGKAQIVVWHKEGISRSGTHTFGQFFLGITASLHHNQEG